MMPLINFATQDFQKLQPRIRIKLMSYPATLNMRRYSNHE
jgi:hypothetical protein